MVDTEMKIVLVDEDRESRQTYGAILRQAGFGVAEGASGQDALRLAADDPTVMILEVNLPDINGYEVCRRIKSHPATNDIPVLHFSQAFSRSEERTHSLEDGADANLPKSAPAEELLAQVKALCRARHAGRVIRAAARQWKNGLDAISDAVCLTNADGEVLRCNRAMADLLGHDFRDIVGRELRPLIAPLFAPNPAPDLGAVLRTGKRESLEVRALGRWYHVTVSPLRGERGEMVGSVQVYADITEFKQADEDRIRLLTERARVADHLNLLLESTGEGIIGLDVQGTCTFVNRAGAEMCGHSPGTLVGQNVHSALRPGRAEEDTPLARVLSEGVGCAGIGDVFWRREGTWFPVEYSAQPIRGGHGHPTGAVLAFSDVTERQRLQRLLTESQKLEAAGRLAAGLAHDFNNLVSIVVSNAGLLLAGRPANDLDRPALEAIDRAGWRAAELVSRLLGFARQARPNLAPVTLTTALEEVELMLRGVLDPRIVFSVRNGVGLWPVMADLGQVNQVLINLCLNARAAMAGGGRLTIETHNVIIAPGDLATLGSDARPGAFVRLSVQDTGTGIPDAIRARVFDPFFSATEGGSGLGLAVVALIVRQHEGWITINSASGQGTRFDIYLPRTTPTTGHLASPPAWIPMGRGEVVLVVDDEPALRDIYSQVLRRAGFHVLTAGDGADAIHVFRSYEGRIDVVVMDHIMPRLSGTEALLELRSLASNLQVVFLTGDPAHLPERALFPEIGAMLIKPFRPEVFVSTVAGVLAGR